MNEPESQYKWSDAWFLLAVYYVSPNGQPSPLSRIIGAADYINHAILTVAEIKSAAYKLTRDGWVIFQADEFSATEKMISKFTGMPAKSPMSQMEIVENWLGAAAYEGDDDPNIPTAPDFEPVTEEMVDLATSEYKNDGKVVL